MTRTEQTCPCGQPVTSTVLCNRCTDKTLSKALDNVRDYFADLDTLRTKQTRFGSGSGGGRSVGKSMPLGFDTRFDRGGRATEAEKLTRQIVFAWSSRIAAEQPALLEPTCETECLHRSCAMIRRRRRPTPSVAGCCAYLQRHRRYIATRDYAPELLDLLLGVENQLRRLVDRPADLWYAGRCGSQTDMLDEHDQVIETVVCERELYATKHATFVRCPACGCEYDVPARRDALLTEAEDRLATVESIVRIVTTLGDVKVSSAKISARIRQWANRNKLKAHGKRVIDGRERPTYRVGDVLDLLAEDTKEKSPA